MDPCPKFPVSENEEANDILHDDYTKWTYVQLGGISKPKMHMCADLHDDYTSFDDPKWTCVQL